MRKEEPNINDKRTVGSVTNDDLDEILNNQSETDSRGIDARGVSARTGATEPTQQPPTKVVEKKTGAVEAGEKAVGAVRKTLMWIACKIFVILWSMFWFGVIMNVFGLTYDTHTTIVYILFSIMVLLIVFWTPFYGE